MEEFQVVLGVGMKIKAETKEEAVAQAIAYLSQSLQGKTAPVNFDGDVKLGDIEKAIRDSLTDVMSKLVIMPTPPLVSVPALSIPDKK